jgi:hypothetical protein
MFVFASTNMLIRCPLPSSILILVEIKNLVEGVRIWD